MSAGQVDELDRTARQVRIDRAGSTVHDVHDSFLDPSGMAYLTRCDYVMTKAEGAILTTREATCGPCLRGGR